MFFLSYNEIQNLREMLFVQIKPKTVLRGKKERTTYLPFS